MTLKGNGHEKYSYIIICFTKEMDKRRFLKMNDSGGNLQISQFGNETLYTYNIKDVRKYGYNSSYSYNLTTAEPSELVVM